MIRLLLNALPLGLLLLLRLILVLSIGLLRLLRVLLLLTGLARCSQSGSFSWSLGCCCRLIVLLLLLCMLLTFFSCCLACSSSCCFCSGLGFLLSLLRERRSKGFKRQKQGCCSD